MDSFYEHLITMRPTKKDRLLAALIWVAAFILVFGAVRTALGSPALIGLMLMAVILVFWGATKLISRFNIEYEVIVVNKDVDIDKIIAKSSRKRMISLKLTDVEEYGVYDEKSAERLAKRNFEFKLNCANFKDDAVYLIYRHPKKGMSLVVIQKEERLEKELLRFIPVNAVNK